MDFLTVFLLSLAISPVALLPPPSVIEGNERKTIPEINKGLNLREGDIMQDNTGVQRSAVLGDQYRWDGYIPYVLNETLSMNDKGVILKAFEQMRLKACVDFKPRTTEEDYVSVESLTGCWSDVGKRGGKQQLSIGTECAYSSTVQHEFLHCLGFFHEQSRYDRDDYVEIIHENVIPDKLHNFDKVSEQEGTTQGTPYDYTSMMHYSKDAFTNGNGLTIRTKDPKFQIVIGQEYGLSPMDSYELNKLYNCTESISFLDHCSFEYSMCQMTACSSSANGWFITGFVPGGPYSDHSSLPSIGVPVVSMTSFSSGPSYFMHFTMESGQEGDSGVLESKEMTPRRDCNVQCLEFFYYHSGSETDQLNIWIREYQNDADMMGIVRHINQISGPPTNHWQLHYVPLDADKPFMVEFEARKGAGYSRGGFSVDDINFLESECPHNVWQIENFMERWNASAPGSYMYSPLYYSPEGYRYQALLKLEEDAVSIYVRLVSGVYDEQLQWPCPWRQVTFVLLDQNPDIRLRLSSQDSLTTDPAEMFEGHYVWGKPSEVGSTYTYNDETEYVTESKGFDVTLAKARLSDREFVKGGDLILLFSMQDISKLQMDNSLPCPTVKPKNGYVFPYQGAGEGPCVAR
ncbi:meprin A subunit beta-like [Salminus brasiliensis]|uniref:meprin A subunit beta-like n=1 Tax=Salminus brasiliensis TaxID=930266 RepID=UPI003B833481